MSWAINTTTGNSGGPPPLTALWQRLRGALVADPKKSAILGALLAVLTFSLVRTLLLDGGARNTQANAATVSPAGAGSAAGSRTSAGYSGDAGAHAGPSSAMQKWADAPVSPVSRNLFAVRIDYFPVDGSRTQASASSEDSFWDRLEKSLAIQADQRDKRENLIANFTTQAAKLRLESTMMGPQAKAMINGELVGEGSVVASFRVLKIESRRVIVEREGIRLEIEMR